MSKQNNILECSIFLITYIFVNMLELITRETKIQILNMKLVYHHQEGLSQRVEIFLLQIEKKSAIRYSTQCKAKRLLRSLSASQYESLGKQTK